MSMKLGLGLYPHILTDENFRFARQAGATHIVAVVHHQVNQYFLYRAVLLQPWASA